MLEWTAVRKRQLDVIFLLNNLVTNANSLPLFSLVIEVHYFIDDLFLTMQINAKVVGRNLVHDQGLVARSRVCASRLF